MELSVLQQDLEHLDRLDSDTLLLFLPETDGPLTGLAGLVDWRLTGRLSRFLLRGWLCGKKGEKLLIPTHGRLPVGKIIGIGIGPPESLDMSAIEDLSELAGRTLSSAKVPSAACSLPGEPLARDEARNELRVLRRGLCRHFDGRLVLLGDSKMLAEVVEEA